MLRHFLHAYPSFVRHPYVDGARYGRTMPTIRFSLTLHPADWRNPDPAPRYNLVVIGAGTAGLHRGRRGRTRAKVALIEKALMAETAKRRLCSPKAYPSGACFCRRARRIAMVWSSARDHREFPGGDGTDAPITRRMKATIPCIAFAAWVSTSSSVKGGFAGDTRLRLATRPTIS